MEAYQSMKKIKKSKVRGKLGERGVLHQPEEAKPRSFNRMKEWNRVLGASSSYYGRTFYLINYGKRLTSNFSKVYGQLGGSPRANEGRKEDKQSTFKEMGPQCSLVQTLLVSIWR